VQTTKVFFCPSCLNFDNASQSPRPECVRGVVERESNSTPIRVPVMSVAAFLSLQLKIIGLQGGNELAGSSGTKFREINCHTVTATTG
jgi:hypothetical protein